MPQFSQITRTDRHNPSGGLTRSKQNSMLFSSGQAFHQIAQEDDATQYLLKEPAVSKKHSQLPGFSFSSMRILPDSSQLRDSANPVWLPRNRMPAIWPIQAKLAINRPGDRYEEEADRAAEQVMRMPDPVTIKGPVPLRIPLVQRSCPKCKKNAGEREKDDKARLQIKSLSTPTRSAAQAMPSSVPPIVHEALRSPGRPLDSVTRGFMEPCFGHDFSRVRVHTDAKAAGSARAVNALAYTAGLNMVFGAGHYAPGASSGQRLIAHELAHAVQQTGNLVMRKEQDPAAPSPMSSEWDMLPEDARDVLEYSFITRHEGEWIWGDHKTALDCYNDKKKWSDERRIAFKNVYDALSQQGLWLWVERISTVYTQNVNGIMFKPDNRDDLAERLSKTHKFCGEMDWRLAWMKRRNPPEWREVVATGSPGLHIILPKSGLCDAHVDILAPIKGRDPNGDCIYSISTGAKHMRKDLWGL